MRICCLTASGPTACRRLSRIPTAADGWAKLGEGATGSLTATAVQPGRWVMPAHPAAREEPSAAPPPILRLSCWAAAGLATALSESWEVLC